MNLWTGIAMLVIAFVLTWVGRPDKAAVRRCVSSLPAGHTFIYRDGCGRSD